MAVALAAAVAGCSWLVGVDGDPVVVDADAGEADAFADAEAATPAEDATPEPEAGDDAMAEEDAPPPEEDASM